MIFKDENYDGLFGGDYPCVTLFCWLENRLGIKDDING